MSSRPKVVITRRIPRAGITRLEAHCDVSVASEEPAVPSEVVRQLASDCDGLLTTLSERIDEAVLAAAPRLKVVSNYAVGFDNIDVAAATRRGVLVCNTPRVLTETTADMAWTLLMAAGRRLVESVDYARAGRWLIWGPTLLLGQDIHHATLGIVGLGQIGQAVARRARGFDMTVLYWDQFQPPNAAELGATYVELDELLRRSDFVSLHVPLLPETRHLINDRSLALMKPTAVLVNSARGPIVDTDALVRALQAGTIFAAGLDVTDPEPLPADHPLMRLPNCIVVPHIASASVATRDAMAELAADNLLAGLRGELPPACVNPEALKRDA